MGLWSLIRDMFVFDWLFGHHKKGSFGEHQRENHPYAYSHNDYAQQDFDDDLDSGMFDDF